MTQTKKHSSWVGNLIQGILMIVLAIVVFNNPQTVLSTIAIWLGIGVAGAGLIGIISWFNADKDQRSTMSILGSVVMLLVGLSMAFEIAITIKAITMIFGAFTAFLGLTMLLSSLNNRSEWSLWWVVSLLGLFTLITGIKAIFDSYSGSESISFIIGMAILLSGFGLIALALLKRKVVIAIKKKIGTK